VDCINRHAGRLIVFCRYFNGEAYRNFVLAPSEVEGPHKLNNYVNFVDFDIFNECVTLNSFCLIF
jgi:hypothetical protein